MINNKELAEMLIKIAEDLKLGNDNDKTNAIIYALRNIKNIESINIKFKDTTINSDFGLG